MASSAAAQPADGAPTEDRAARARFSAGVAFYDAGRFEEALPEFEAAWRLSHRPQMLVNIASAAEGALRFGRAVEALEEYLRLVPAAEDRPAVEARLVRDRRAAERLRGGEHTSDAAGEPRSGGSSLPLVGWVTLGAGGALGVAALITGLVSHSTYTSLDADCAMGLCPAGRASDIDQGQTMGVVSTVLTGLAAVAGAVGIVLVIAGGGGDDGEGDEADAARVVLVPGLGGGSVRVRF